MLKALFFQSWYIYNLGGIEHCLLYYRWSKLLHSLLGLTALFSPFFHTRQKCSLSEQSPLYRNRNSSVFISDVPFSPVIVESVSRARVRPSVMSLQRHFRLPDLVMEDPFILKGTVPAILLSKVNYQQWVKLGQATAENQASRSMRLLRKQLCHTIPLCFCSSLRFISFVVALSFQASSHQRFMKRRNGCRESCLSTNWSISAQLKPANGECKCNLVTTGLLEI